MSPAWHPNGRRIVYSRMSDVGTQIEQLDLETGNIKSVSATGTQHHARIFKRRQEYRLLSRR